MKKNSIHSLIGWIILGFENITWLGFSNYFIQFLFIRIYKSVDKGKIKGYGILYFVLPLSGWFNNYAVLTKKLRFTKLLYKCK